MDKTTYELVQRLKNLLETKELLSDSITLFDNEEDILKVCDLIHKEAIQLIKDINHLEKK